MDVSPEISSTTGETVPISETVDAPVFAKRSAMSRVVIKDGQTIVIGGLLRDGETVPEKGFPLLGDLPVVGSLLRQKTNDNQHLILMITPRIIAAD